jgi:hypothetical protein
MTDPVEALGLASSYNEIDQITDALYKKASQIVDEFHKERDERMLEDRAGGTKTAPISYLFCRVKKHASGFGFSIEWNRHRTIKKRGDGSGPNTEYLRKGKTYQYSPKNVFDFRTLDWEKELFYKYESQFTRIRQVLDSIGKVRIGLNKHRVRMKRISMDNLF